MSFIINYFDMMLPLKRRKQCVSLGDAVSNCKEITSSVPQGSVISPFLFVVYINDLTDCSENEFKMYVYDNKVIAVNKPDIKNRAQFDINNTV